jgi:hypothetical protein
MLPLPRSRGARSEQRSPASGIPDRSKSVWVGGRRTVDPESKEGGQLLRDRKVTFIGPEGTALGRVDLDQARRLLKLRLLSVLAASGGGDGAEAIRDGLVRLRRAAPRAGRA